jgi:DNA-binding NtrC family response regulator
MENDDVQQAQLTDQNFPSLKEVERKHIYLALKVTNGNKAKAAKILGITQKTLYNKFHKYFIDNLKAIKAEED